MEQQTAVTAVDWFFEEIKSHFTKDGDVFEDIVFTMSLAKLKEKRQIIGAYKDAITLHGSDEWKQSEAEQYYKENFQKLKED